MKKKVIGGLSQGGGSVECYKFGFEAHRSIEGKETTLKFFKCGKAGHRTFECKGDEKTCFNCGEKGHISIACKKPKKDKARGKVFAINAEEVKEEENLSKGIFFINTTRLISINDTGAAHSFISLACARRFHLGLSHMSCTMVIDTPTIGSVTTSIVCVSCPLSFGWIDLCMDLVCLHLEHMDVIFGRDWLLALGININFLTNSVTFSSPKERVERMFLTASQVESSLSEEAQLFVMFASFKVEKKKRSGDVPIVVEFPDVFPDGITNLPPEREVEFPINLVPGTSTISMEPYRMCASELIELKK